MKTLLPHQVWRHTIGTPSSQDELVYEEKDDTFMSSLHKTTSRHVVIFILPAPTTQRSAITSTRNWPMPSRFHSYRAAKTTNIVSITIISSFTCALTGTVKNFGLYRTRVRNEKRPEELIPPRASIYHAGRVYPVFYRLVSGRRASTGLTSPAAN
ncbi:hypothetical protein KCP71_17495 [Salmonella enterica subsp. enterica]|nr:hypothetical protein KCP71_17495 [Salmonella enterica subsp. enterica]